MLELPVNTSQRLMRSQHVKGTASGVLCLVAQRIRGIRFCWCCSANAVREGRFIELLVISSIIVCSLLQGVEGKCWPEDLFPIFPASAMKPLNGNFHGENLEGCVARLHSGEPQDRPYEKSYKLGSEACGYG